jgi:hypothetical protein
VALHSLLEVKKTTPVLKCLTLLESYSGNRSRRISSAHELIKVSLGNEVKACPKQKNKQTKYDLKF